MGSRTSARIGGCLAGVAALLAALVLCSTALGADPIEGTWDQPQYGGARVTQTGPGQFTGVTTTTDPAAPCPIPVGTTLFRLTAAGDGINYSGTAVFYNVPGCDSFESPATATVEASHNNLVLTTLIEVRYTRAAVAPENIPTNPYPSTIGPQEGLFEGSPSRVSYKLFVKGTVDDFNCINQVTCNPLQAQDRLIWWMAAGLLTEGIGTALKPVAGAILKPAAAAFARYSQQIAAGSKTALVSLRAELSRLALSASAKMKLPAAAQRQIEGNRVMSILKPYENGWVGAYDKQKKILTVETTAQLTALYRQLKIGTTPLVTKTPVVNGQARQLPSGAALTLRNGTTKKTVGPTINLPKLPGVEVVKIKAKDHRTP